MAFTGDDTSPVISAVQMESAAYTLGTIVIFVLNDGLSTTFHP